MITKSYSVLTKFRKWIRKPDTLQVFIILMGIGRRRHDSAGEGLSDLSPDSPRSGIPVIGLFPTFFNSVLWGTMTGWKVQAKEKFFLAYTCS